MFFLADSVSAFDWHAAINSLLSGVSIVTLVVFAVYFGRYSERVDTMWQAFLQNGIVSGVRRGTMEVHSPARLVNGSGDVLCAMKDELRAFYDKNCQGKSESDAALLIQKEFGSRLTNDVWVPNGIPVNEGLMIAVAVAKGTETLTQILNHVLPQKPEDPATTAE